MIDKKVIWPMVVSGFFTLALPFFLTIASIMIFMSVNEDPVTKADLNGLKNSGFFKAVIFTVSYFSSGFMLGWMLKKKSAVYGAALGVILKVLYLPLFLYFVFSVPPAVLQNVPPTSQRVLNFLEPWSIILLAVGAFAGESFIKKKLELQYF